MVDKVSEELAPYIRAGEEVIDSSIQAGSEFINYITGGEEVQTEEQVSDPLNDFMRQQGIIDDEGKAGDTIEKEFTRQPISLRPTVEEEEEEPTEFFKEPDVATTMPEQYKQQEDTATPATSFMKALERREGVVPHVLNGIYHLPYGIIPDKGTVMVNGERREPTKSEVREGTAVIDLTKVTKEGIAREEFVTQARANISRQGRTDEEYERVIQKEAGINFATEVVEVTTDKTKKALKSNTRVSQSFSFNKLSPQEQMGLVDLAWNVGQGSMKKWKDVASLANELMKSTEKRDIQVLLEFTNNIKADGKRSVGILKRRLEEYNSFVPYPHKAKVIKVEQNQKKEWVYVAYAMNGDVLRSYATDGKPSSMRDLPVPQGE